MPGSSTCTCSSSLRTRLLFSTCITIPTFQENVGDGADQGGQPLSPLPSWHIPPLGSQQSLPQHLSVHRTAPAWKIMGHHPVMCIPLGRLGNTSLQNPHTVRVHYRCTTAITRNLKIQSASP